MEKFPLQGLLLPVIGVRTARTVRILTMKPTRYAPLRPHAASILTSCMEGRPWEEMVEILAKAGCRVTPPSIQNMATRKGWVLIHPYSSHFRESIRAAFL